MVNVDTYTIHGPFGVYKPTFWIYHQCTTPTVAGGTKSDMDDALDGLAEVGVGVRKSWMFVGN